MRYVIKKFALNVFLRALFFCRQNATSCSVRWAMATSRPCAITEDAAATSSAGMVSP